MGSTVYCEKCRCAVKLFDSNKEFLACDHDMKYANFNVFYSPYDGSHGIKLWNEKFPDNKINEKIYYATIPSPYQINNLAELLEEAEKIKMKKFNVLLVGEKEPKEIIADEYIQHGFFIEFINNTGDKFEVVDRLIGAFIRRITAI